MICIYWGSYIVIVMLKKGCRILIILIFYLEGGGGLYWSVIKIIMVILYKIINWLFCNFILDLIK